MLQYPAHPVMESKLRTGEMSKKGGDFSVISEYLILAARDESSQGLTDRHLENAFSF